MEYGPVPKQHVLIFSILAPSSHYPNPPTLQPSITPILPDRPYSEIATQMSSVSACIPITMLV
jgi:hypothetical protein